MYFLSLRLPKTQRSPYASCLAYNSTSMVSQRKPWTPSNISRHSSNQKTPKKIFPSSQFNPSKANVKGLQTCYRRICNVCIGSVWILFRFSKKNYLITLALESIKNETIKIILTDAFYPASTRRRFDVDAMLFGRQQRCIDVETTSYAYWVTVSLVQFEVTQLYTYFIKFS